jgi:RNA polymerase sigma-70 factor, ECF subfamily
MNEDVSDAWRDCAWPRLLDAARAGDRVAADEVFFRLSNYCLLVAGSRLPSDLTAKLGASDIVQKSFLEAFTRIRSFAGCTEAEIRGWLYTIIDRNAIDAVRYHRDAQGRNPSREQPINVGDEAMEIAGPSQRPSFAMRRDEEDAALVRAVAGLSDNRRRVVELRYRDCLDFRGVAAAMGLSEAAARKLCSRAIEELRLALADDDEHRAKPPA